MSSEAPKPERPAKFGVTDKSLPSPEYKTSEGPEVLQAELVRKLEPYVNKQNVQRAAQTVMRVVMTEMHQGPLPPARELALYNEVIPNGAERIMQMAEHEQAFNHEQARTAIRANIRFATAGQIMAFFMGLSFIGGAVACTYLSLLPLRWLWWVWAQQALSSHFFDRKRRLVRCRLLKKKRWQGRSARSIGRKRKYGTEFSNLGIQTA